GFMLFTAPKQLTLHKLTDIKYFLGTGIFSFIFFNFCMFMAIDLATIPMATALLYTAPAFVAVSSFFLFNELLIMLKITSMLIKIIGTSFVACIVPLDPDVLHVGSLLFGLGSGIGYALYSIFSKFALKKYTSLVITTFTFVVAGVALI